MATQTTQPFDDYLAVESARNAEHHEHVARLRSELAERRTAAQREVDEAQRDLGSALVDQASGAPAGKRLAAARAELEAVDAAEDELARRVEDEWQRYEVVAVHGRRSLQYRAMVAYFEQAEVVLRARAALADAESALDATEGAALVRQGQRRIARAEQPDLDGELVVASPKTPEACRELRAKAQRLAEAEEIASGAACVEEGAAS